MDDIDLMKMKQEFRKMCEQCWYKNECEKSNRLNNWIGTLMSVAALVMAVAMLLIK